MNVTITGEAYCWPGMPEQTLKVYFKGKHLADFPFSDEKPLEELKFVIPKKLVSDGEFKIQFKFKEPLMSPKEQGLPLENKTLGFFFKSMAVTSKK